MSYTDIRLLHVSCAAISYLLFFVRGVWMIADSPLLTRRWVRVLPHVNDTLLLAAAVSLAIWSRQYPLEQGWLTAKLVALMLYIALGMAALKPGMSRSRRIAAWVAAQGVFFYIVAVALTRNPLPLPAG
jgi:uncharacterized membrane protein SirB2